MENEPLRLDRYLVEHGHATGRDKAKELCLQGFITVNGKVVTKCSAAVLPGDTVLCSAPAEKYVGRGGYKLEKALPLTGVDLHGKTAMDIGASTGGFTDCMLQNGAAKVYAVDVGHDQLHPALREDDRVVVLEGTDVRSEALRTAVPLHTVDFCSVDVSFVSLTAVIPAILPYMSPMGTVVCLIKPQFEAGKSGIGKHGVVKDPKVHIRVLASLIGCFADLGWPEQTVTWSPITGGEGNIEYLANLKPVAVTEATDVSELVKKAFEALR